MAIDNYDLYSGNVDELNDATNKYIDSLIDEAKGDRNFIIKKLDAEHDLALGTDNQAQAQFLEKVADGLEKRIGRIPYDYEKYTARELEDYARNSRIVAEDKSTALTRLDEDERVYKEEARIAAKESRISKQEELASRGLIQGTLAQAGGIAGQEAGKLENEILMNENALDRAVGRERFDINTSAFRSDEENLLNKNRNLDDIKTTARRGAGDQIMAYNFGKEDANRQFNKTKTSLNRQREYDLRSNKTLASSPYITPQNYNG